jgi:uncharacterized protein
MTKVVIDTNVLVSALLKEHGAEAAVLFRVADKRLRWFISPPVLAEYKEVLGRPRFSRIPRPYIDALLTLAERRAELVTPTFKLTVSRHEPDNRFYECAHAAGADYLVTGNRRHFPKDLPPTKIVNARELLAREANS